MKTRDKLKFGLLYLVLTLISLAYKISGRQFLKTAPDPTLSSYYESLPSEQNHLDEY